MHMDALQPPSLKKPRPHRLVVNVDTETRDTLRALAFASGQSVSFVSAECLSLLSPTLRPVVEAMAKLKTAPAEAMADLSRHAGVLVELAEAAVNDARSLGMPVPPSSNTGG